MLNKQVKIKQTIYDLTFKNSWDPSNQIIFYKITKIFHKNTFINLVQCKVKINNWESENEKIRHEHINVENNFLITLEKNMHDNENKIQLECDKKEKITMK